MYQNLMLLAAFVLVYSAVAGRVERTRISGPIIFTVYGLLIGPVGLGLLSFETDAETLKVLAELTLAMVLFTDAAGADMGVLKRATSLPARLLLIGLPLTILLGFGLGALLVDRLSLLELAILATILAPTDAALGKAVVTNQAVPDNIRQGLNVESGLNDGICVPVLFIFLALVAGHSGDESTGKLALMLVAEEIGIGLVVGLLITAIATQLLKNSHKRGWITETWLQLPVVALALTCFATAQWLGGSGFIAAFCGGLLFGVLVKKYREELLVPAEGAGDTFALITWVIFGSAVVGQAVGNFSWLILLYSILSLTVIRMLPVFLSLIGTGFNRKAGCSSAGSVPADWRVSFSRSSWPTPAWRMPDPSP